jgi:hypothetical protein
LLLSMRSKQSSSFTPITSPSQMVGVIENPLTGKKGPIAQIAGWNTSQSPIPTGVL